MKAFLVAVMLCFMPYPALGEALLISGTFRARYTPPPASFRISYTSRRRPRRSLTP